MWSKLFSSAGKWSARPSKCTALRIAQRRFYSSTGCEAAWNNGLLLGVGALGFMCAYLTKKVFALNSDPVSFALKKAHFVEQASLEDDEGELCV